jgi:hypothetical protein
MAITADLDIDQGSNFVVTMDLQNDNGTPMNLTGFQVYSQFRKSYMSAIGHNFTAQILSATTGKIQLTLTGTYSSSIRAGRYLYDVEIISQNNIKTRVVEGIVTINPEITKTP